MKKTAKPNVATKMSSSPKRSKVEVVKTREKTAKTVMLWQLVFTGRAL